MNFLQLMGWICFSVLGVGASVGAAPVQADLVSEVTSIQPGQVFTVALRLRMEEHWHTYAKNPGDAGYPTKIRWDLPSGFTVGEIQWPTPLKIEQPPLTTYGYEGEAWLLQEVRSPQEVKPGVGIVLKARVDWLACKESCIPGGADLVLSLPVRSEAMTQDPQWVQGFETARKKMLTETPSRPLPTMTIGLALFFSFVGGLILNLMPCVLPVLSLKVLSFVKQAGEDPTKVWRHGVAFTLGVLISFWSLAGLLLLLKAAGSQLGWGFQLQSPIFVGLLALLFFLISINLFGVFEFGTSLIGVQAPSAAAEGLSASVWSGVLATVVATPCTAPFMSSALGFAAAQPAGVALLVFTALALGLAAPYLLLSIFPSALRFVPKPGAWMESFKQFLAFPMAATVAGLVWIFGQQTGNDGVLQLLWALILMGAGAWIYGRWGTPVRTLRCQRWAMGAALGLGLVASTWTVRVAQTTFTDTRAEVGWETYSPERLAQLRAEGKPVFVDFTAAWCLTCQVNKKVALEKTEVMAKFKEKGVTRLLADWTRNDPTITKGLSELGRNGVPVYVLYPPKGEPRLLPEVLTPAMVVEALDKLP